MLYLCKLTHTCYRWRATRCAFAVSIVMGIPTIKRERDSYLLQTLESLLSNLDEMEQDDCLIVVFVGEVTNYLLSCNELGKYRYLLV